MIRHNLTRTSLTLATLLYALTAHVRASITTFNATDPGSGVFAPSPRPNSDAMAANFDAAAGSLGALQTINLESLPVGDFSSLTISPGVTASLTGTDSQGGIRTSSDLFFSFDPNSVGYNTTSGGQKFLGVVPTYSAAMARLTLNFSPSIQAFGTYLTGLGTNSGSLFVVFDDGAAQTLQFTGSSSGSAKFIGFTDPGTQISQIAFELRNIGPVSRDVYAVDDLRFVTAAPEPSTLALALIALLPLSRRRK